MKKATQMRSLGFIKKYPDIRQGKENKVRSLSSNPQAEGEALQPHS
ncbi:TPA: hypothetical protein SH488_000087 [Salmonella enterica]|nr:hypothetical protein [Salmonella enterica]